MEKKKSIVETTTLELPLLFLLNQVVVVHKKIMQSYLP